MKIGDDMENYRDAGYPKGKPVYQQATPKTLTPADHFIQPVDRKNEALYHDNDINQSFLIKVRALKYCI